MQRVLSFQTARGFGESSEFITKRMCFSFLFSVGFLCILCGFLVGRFAAGRAIDMRAEKTRLQLAGNGLENTEHLREAMIRWLEENALFNDTHNSDNEEDEREAEKIKDELLSLRFFHSVVGNRSCIAATVLGDRETDRDIVLSGIGEGIPVIVELSRAFRTLKEDFGWRPRRTLKFMISLEDADSCHDFLPSHVRAKVVAFIALNVKSIEGSGYFVTTGSDIVESSVLQAGAGVENPNYNEHSGKAPKIIEACSETSCPNPRLRLDVPNAAITFVSEGNSSRRREYSEHPNAYRRALARIASTAVWRLSEMTLFRWDPRIANTALIEKLRSLNSARYEGIVDAILAAAKKITDRIAAFNATIDHSETTDSLGARISNDLSMEIRRVLLCCDDELRSRNDWNIFPNINANSRTTEENLRELLICYEKANELLHEDET